MIKNEEKVPAAIWELELLKKALATWHIGPQLNQLQEEAGELIVAINHYRRGRNTWENVVEEMCDADIMIKQFLTDQVTYELFQTVRERKMKRLEARLK